MKQEDIIRMAREAWGEHHEIFWFDDDGIERFAALVAAAERQACAEDACDAVAFNGGSVQMELHVRQAILDRGQA